MYRYIFLLLCLSLSFSLTGQKNTKNQLLQIENTLLEQKDDPEAVKLITDHRAAKDEVYDFRLNVMNSYPEYMSKTRKESRFRRENIDNEEYVALQEAEKKAKELKLEYLRVKFPNARFSNQKPNRGKLSAKKRPNR